MVAVQSDRGEAWGGAAEGAALGLKREAALEHFIERRNGRGLVDRPHCLLLTTHDSLLTTRHLLLARRAVFASLFADLRLLRAADAFVGAALCGKQPPRRFGRFARQHAPPAPNQARGGLQPRAASGSLGQLAEVFRLAIPAGRLYRPCFPHRHSRLVDLPSCAARHQRRGGQAASLRAARQATRAALVRVTPPTLVEEAASRRSLPKYPRMPPQTTDIYQIRSFVWEWVHTGVTRAQLL